MFLFDIEFAFMTGINFSGNCHGPKLLVELVTIVRPFLLVVVFVALMWALLGSPGGASYWWLAFWQDKRLDCNKNA
tara:strand:- start:154 stop:381 length:228 start_codon:yes stop_codon:yes gene_type:complete